MKKIKSIFTLFLFLTLIAIKAQQTTITAGGEGVGSGGHVSYSTGQVIYTSLSGANGLSNEGVQQVYDITVGIPENNNISLAYAVYPNPATAGMQLNVGNQKLDRLSFQLYDVTCKLLINQKINSPVTSIAMGGFASATYLLKVFDKDRAVQTFKVIKN